MKIAILAHLRHPIRPPFMGGMEAHCHQLTLQLVRRRHDVTLFASGDSDPVLPLVAVTDRHYEADLPWAQWKGTSALAAFQDAAFATAWNRIGQTRFDVVHNNALYPAVHAWAQADGQPMVTSLHVPPFPALANAVDAHASPWLRQTLTSASHMASWWSDPPETASVVHNGIDIGDWRFRPMGNGRAVWAGRITPNKGTAIAIDAAKRAGIPLDIIGPIDCADYFRNAVAPRLDADHVYHGLLRDDALVDAIGNASVLLATPTWDEPFGLVAAEAMACGVPVAALDRGALREVVGDCGAMAHDVPTLASTISQAMTLSRARCRDRVATCFSIDAMIDGYERAYAVAIAGARASSCANTVAVLA